MYDPKISPTTSLPSIEAMRKKMLCFSKEGNKDGVDRARFELKMRDYAGLCGVI
jgi:hypothetical protein